MNENFTDSKRKFTTSQVIFRFVSVEPFNNPIIM